MEPTKQKMTDVHSISVFSTLPVSSSGNASIARALPSKMPMPTRHRAVLQLEEPLPLYNFSGVQHTSIADLILTTAGTPHLAMINAISTGIQKNLATDSSYAEILIRFHVLAPLVAGKKKSAKPTEDYTVVVPRQWTPRMYLGALYISLQRNKSISVETLKLNGNNYKTINEVSWLFNKNGSIADANYIEKHLLELSAFEKVNGGAKSSF